MTNLSSNLSTEELRRVRQELWSNLEDIDKRLKQIYVPPQFRITTSSTSNQRTFSTNGQTSHELASSVKRARVSSSSMDENPNTHVENQFEESNSTSASTSTKALHSSIVPTNKIIKTKDDLISLVNRDQASANRNRRMFGVLLGTLNKFKAEASSVNEQTVGLKRQEIERRLEEKQAKEREDKQQERSELIASKRTYQQKLKQVNIKLEILQRMANHEKAYLPLRNYIRTKSKPYVFFLPKGPLNEILEKKLQESQQELDQEMEEFKRLCQKDLDQLEEMANNAESTDQTDPSNKKRKMNEDEDEEEEEDDGLADLPDEITLSAPETKNDANNPPLKSSISTTRTVIYDEDSSQQRDEPSSNADD